VEVGAALYRRSFSLWGVARVTKKEIVKEISEKLGLTQLKTKEIVQNTFDAIIETLVEEERIELRNFGVFEVKKRAARRARNPRTGERVDVPEKYVVTFKPGKEMEARVQKLIHEKNALAAEKSSKAEVGHEAHLNNGTMENRYSREPETLGSHSTSETEETN
jgi:nucleoid DNA-binding protein